MPRARLVVALQTEARPLISHFGLDAVEGGAFPLYRGDAIELVISGIGKASAAAATAYLLGLGDGVRDVPWINVGIAGHRSFDLGQGVLAHKIVDQGSGRTSYPQLTFEPPSGVAGAVVTTVDCAEHIYPDDNVYEMEAAGFFSTASRCSTTELVYVYKVISDNNQRDLSQLSAERVTELMSAQVEPVKQLINAGLDLAREMERRHHAADLVPWLERWHFSATERRRLSRLLARLRVVECEEPLTDAVGDCRDAPAALARLESRLSAHSPDF